MKKGDVLGVARIAGIMAAKKTSDLIPLCHPIGIESVSVELVVVDGDEEHPGGEGVVKEQRKEESIRWQGTGQGDGYAWTEIPPTSSEPSIGNKGNGNNGSIEITATVSCSGKTGVEMEALTAASTAALTVYDMCKAVDKGMRIEGLRVVRKEGGKSGVWIEGKQGK